MNLRQELEKIHGRKLYDDAVAKITLSYRVANGIDGRITKESDKAAILEIERAKLNQQTALSDEAITENMLQPVTIAPAQKYKQPVYADKYAYKTMTVFIGANKARHVIKLENFYIDALKQIGVDSVPLWIAATVSDEWNETTGDKSIMKIVKASIVNALIERVKK
jgi:hypothetical protein